ncbi:hypothetical protein ACFX12_043227 [Malus domestica]
MSCLPTSVHYKIKKAKEICADLLHRDTWTRIRQLTRYVSGAGGSLRIVRVEFCNMDASKGSMAKTKEEIRVETVDYRSPAGEDKEAKKEDVEVVHEIRDGGAKSEGVHPFAGAAAAVANTIQSAKDAISGNAKESKDDKTTE